MRKVKIRSFLDSVFLYKEILDIFNNNNLESYGVKYNKDNSMTLTFPRNETKYVDLISSVISSYLIKVVEARLIKHEVEIECYDLLEKDIQYMIERIKYEIIDKDKELTNKRIEKYKNEITKIINESDEINIDGYLRFRFKEREFEIKNYVDSVIDVFFDEIESEIMLSIFSEIVDKTKPKTETMNVIVVNKNHYELITGDKKRIDLKDVENIAYEMLDFDEDIYLDVKQLVLTSLVTYVAERIIIHDNERLDKDFASLLKKVFNYRVEECSGCEYCKSIKNIFKK